MNTVTEFYLSAADGVQLYTTLQLPEKEGKFPLIIIRTPYAQPETDFQALAEADTHGYAILTQHCRGTGRSEGICRAYLDERADGLLLLEWIRQQPFYNSELFLLGSSYLASVHFSYLNTDPPDIKAAFLAVQDTERYNICFRKGFFKSGLHGSWVLRMHRKNQSVPRHITEDLLKTHPLAGSTRKVFGEYVPYIEESFSHPDPEDPYWSSSDGGGDYRDACNRCNIPILLVTSMYDIYTDGIFTMWQNLKPERKKQCALVVSPLDHAWNPLPENLAPEYLQFRDGLLREFCPDLEYQWFDHFRKGTDLPFIKKGETTYYRLWDNSWHSTPELQNAPEEKKYFLTPSRGLSETSAEGKLTYVYDPADPASFEGGVCNNFGGMKYQSPPNSRQDILSFLSAPLTEDMICEGRIEVTLTCSSTAEDSCFYVRLSFEREGKTLSLRDDIDSLCRKEKNYIPGSKRILHYTFAPHAFKLFAGDRLRLDVSSSCVPYFYPHSNLKGLQTHQTATIPCQNTIYTKGSFVKIHKKTDFFQKTT
ncbi:MAG: CocE/NonD family hydrolase [Lentisphaeria bacterium]|nr:CocE/NonD family hydrolase [Lentisphaeria bacterium]